MGGRFVAAGLWEAGAMERRLEAILYADVAGYSRLMGADEEGTHATLKVRLQALTDTIAGFGGRVCNFAGDAVLAEFGSVVTALRCAVAAQRDLAERERDVPEHRRLRFRMGVNLGDLIIDGAEIYGNGVNVAARLESLAEPGGICISGRVLEQVKGNVDIGFADLGPHSVKNIEKPVNVYKVLFDPKDAGRVIDLVKPEPARWRRVAAAGVALFFAATVGMALWQKPTETSTQVASDEKAAPRLPSVAVLPFENMSGDPQLNYFSDGVTEDIITALSQDPYLAVTARNSTFKYRSEAVDVREVGSELGVGYVLEGSVRKVHDTVRITAQLIDAKSGDNVWADRFDEEGADPFKMQDDIAGKISTTLLGLSGEVQRNAEKAAWRNKGISLDEYDYMLRGHAFWVRFTKEDMAEARRIFSEGLERFPDSGLLRIKVGWTLAVNAFYVWSDNPKRDMDRAYTLAIEGMKDPHLPRVGEWYGHWLLAWLYLWHDRDFDRAVAEANATLAIAPSHPDSLISLCLVFDFSGQPDTCLRNLDKAMSPSGKAPWWYAHRYYGWAYYLKDECGQAIEHLAKVTKRDINTYRLRAACYARLGKSDLAREAVTEILSISPHESLSGLRKQLPYRKSEDLERLLADLRKAGLPE